ncbi:hypothetical protein EV356DRAFT_224541 [Viridothelium virens]|uniref:Uncharacterized protein n=1 Tax=Viridothelium virens TaxID=1048519 RepID=A0A6A6HLG0_VIRVR|nr:hypothetical protein EV356DRAFT_224541 [Viridothelium virens]
MQMEDSDVYDDKGLIVFSISMCFSLRIGGTIGVLSSTMPENQSKQTFSPSSSPTTGKKTSGFEHMVFLRGGGPTRRLEDDERAPAVLWWFAGGKGRPPTGEELRAAKQARRPMMESRERCGLCAAICGRRHQEE